MVGQNHPNGCLASLCMGIVPNVPPVATWAIANSLSVVHTLHQEQTCIELAFEHILNNVSVEFESNGLGQNPKGGKDILGVLLMITNTALAQIWDERIEDFLPLGISNLFLFDGEQVKELAEQEAPPPVVFEAIRALWDWN